jgi:hypothetical protein
MIPLYPEELEHQVLLVSKVEMAVMEPMVAPEVQVVIMQMVILDHPLVVVVVVPVVEIN